MRNFMQGFVVLSVLAAAVAQALPDSEEIARLNAHRHLHPVRPIAPNDNLDGGADGNTAAGDLRADVSNQAGTGTTASPQNLVFHGGTVLNHLSVRVVYAGPKWASAAFANDKITGIDAFFGGYSGSAYATSADEYIGSNGEVGSTLRYQGHEAPSATSVSVDGSKMNTVVAAVCGEVSRNKFVVATGTQMIGVYTDMARPATAKYCGYHGAMSCSGQTIQYAFYWSLDGDSGCNAADSLTGHSQGLASLVNVTGHEVAETRTDPELQSWFDTSGNENADKCAWTFKHSYVTLKNGTKWKVQSIWSNAANDAGTGYPALGGGYKACIDGQ